MTVTKTCDGCGVVQGVDPFATRGWFSTVDYCKSCAAVYDEFVGKRDEFHTDLATQWTSGVKKLKETYKAANPEMRFPDE